MGNLNEDSSLFTRFACHPFYTFLFSSLMLTDQQGRTIATVGEQNALLVCCNGSSNDPVARSASYWGDALHHHFLASLNS
jgi:hypothetical protein